MIHGAEGIKMLRKVEENSMKKSKVCESRIEPSFAEWVQGSLTIFKDSRIFAELG